MLIYCIENQIDGKKYVGKTNNLEKRTKEHFENTHNVKLRRAFDKYGKGNFEVHILQDGLTETEVNSAEQYFIAKLDTVANGYNLTLGGEGGNTLLDPVIAEKHRTATSVGKTGKQRAEFSAEHKAKLSAILKQYNGSRKTSKPVIVEGKYFASQHEASRVLGILQATIHYRLKAGLRGYKYL